MLDEAEVLEFQYELVPKAKKVSMIQQFFADVEAAAAPPSPILLQQNGDLVGVEWSRRRRYGIEAGLAAAATAVTTAIVEPTQVNKHHATFFLCNEALG